MSEMRERVEHVCYRALRIYLDGTDLRRQISSHILSEERSSSPCKYAVGVQIEWKMMAGDSRFDPWYARCFVCSLALDSFFCLPATAIIDDVVVFVAAAVPRLIGGSSSAPAVITLSSQFSLVLSAQCLLMQV
ncbi:hypothetical protein GQ42DRAFT_156244 [Ramicandelaber brevisporus]|nr:hypothetical protein GQ42DRAFT_156244 [Ramicandelaber brevisporus]